MKVWVLAGVFLGCGAWANVFFKNACPVLNSPRSGGQTICRRTKGAEVRRIKKAPDPFFFIESDGCRGYVASNCLKQGEAPAKKEVSASAEIERQPASYRSSFFRVGPLLTAGSLWGRPGEGADVTRGTDFGAGLSIAFAFASSFRFSLIPLFEMLKLTRNLDGTGSIADPNPGSYEQKVNYLGGAFLAGIRLEGEARSRTGNQEWWFDFGGEYLTPLSATQTDNLGNVIQYTSPDKLAFLVLGPSGDYNVSDSILLSGYLQFMYNLGSREGAQLFGGRFRVALNFDF